MPRNPRPKYRDLPEHEKALIRQRSLARYYRLKDEGTLKHSKYSINQSRRQALRRFGITPEDYRQMLKKQRGVCAICRQPEYRKSSTTQEPKILALDHCHKTNKVRQLLCHDCNIGLGMFHDDVARMLKAVRYLRRHATSVE